MLGKKEFLEALRDSPVIAAVKNPEGLQNCLTSDCSIAFVLYGDMLNIAGIVAQLKEAGKLAFVHIDLVDGLTSQDVVVDFIAKNTCADGIISTKHSLVRHAKGCGLLTVQRFFVLDSMALFNIGRQLATAEADAVEILPGVMPKVIRKISGSTDKPIIAGGLISDKEDVINALAAGAVSVSSTQRAIWVL